MNPRPPRIFGQITIIDLTQPDDPTEYTGRIKDVKFKSASLGIVIQQIDTWLEELEGSVKKLVERVDTLESGWEALRDQIDLVEKQLVQHKSTAVERVAAPPRPPAPFSASSTVTRPPARGGYKSPPAPVPDDEFSKYKWETLSADDRLFLELVSPGPTRAYWRPDNWEAYKAKIHSGQIRIEDTFMKSIVEDGRKWDQHDYQRIQAPFNMFGYRR
jgi:hypothetical protein